MDTSGCVSLRAPHLKAISLSAIEKWELWSLDIKIAFLQADGFDRDAYLFAPDGWEPSRRERVWELKAPAYGLNDAPVASRRFQKRHLLNSVAPMKSAGLRCQASTIDPYLFSVFREEGSVVGGFTTHIDDILGYGEPDVLAKMGF